MDHRCAHRIDWLRHAPAEACQTDRVPGSIRGRSEFRNTQIVNGLALLPPPARWRVGSG
jgi:hypothetical protein